MKTLIVLEILFISFFLLFFFGYFLFKIIIFMILSPLFLGLSIGFFIAIKYKKKLDFNTRMEDLIGR